MMPLNTWTSVMALCNQMSERFKLLGHTTTMAVHDFEAHANTQELPNTDLIGPVSFAIEELSSHIFGATFAIGISTVDDKGLFRHRTMAAKLFEELRPERRLELYDAENSQVLGWMKVRDGTVLMPMSSASTRALQFIQADVLIDPHSA